MPQAKRLVLLAPAGRFRDLAGTLNLPVALCSMAGYLAKRMPDLDTHVIDLQTSFGFPLTEAAEDKLLSRAMTELMPLLTDDTLVGISCHANRDIVHALALARAVKEEANVPVVLGGYAPSTCYPLVLEHYAHLFDAVAVGAGERATEGLLQRMKGSTIVRKHEIPGIAFVQEGRLVVTDRAEAVPLDAFPKLSLAPLHDHEAYEFVPYYTTSGCPFACDFCFERSVHPEYRKRDPQRVLKDLEQTFARYIRPRHVAFVDPLFGFDAQRSTALCRGLRARDITCSFYTRTDLLKREMYEALAGVCEWIFLGVEAASAAALTAMQKTRDPQAYLQSVREQVGLCFDHGITPQLGFMPNYPLTTQQDAEAILRLLDELAELYAKRGQGAGLAVTVFAYHIWYGSQHYRDLEDLLARGMTVTPGFPDVYHGIPVPRELRQDVCDASPDLSWNAFQTLRQQIYSKAVRTGLATAHVARHNFMFVNAGQNRLWVLDGGEVRFVDADQDCIDIKSMMRERHRTAG